MTANKVKSLVNEEADSCSATSVAFKLGISVGEVKKSFPLEKSRTVQTGLSNDGGFVVRLEKKGIDRVSDVFESLWTLHGYDRVREELSVEDRNRELIESMSRRPDCPIASENGVRQQRRPRADSAIKTEVKSTAFFGGAKSTAVKEETSKTKAKTPFETKKTVPVKTEEKKLVKKEKVSESPVSESRKPDGKNKSAPKAETKSSKNSSEKSKKSEGAKEAAALSPPSNKAEATEPADTNRRSRKRKSSRDRSAGDSEDEIGAKKQSKKKRKAVFESDSDDDRMDDTETGVSPKEVSSTSSTKKNKTTLKVQQSTKKETETTVKNTKSSPKGDGKRRRRVLKEVTHTFKTEDGFLETKLVKEMVSETDSEDESAKNDSKKNIKKTAKTPVPTNRSQSSISSFFKKQ